MDHQSGWSVDDLIVSSWTWLDNLSLFTPPALFARKRAQRRNTREDGNAGGAGGNNGGVDTEDIDVSDLHVGQPLEALKEVLDWQRRRRQQQGGGGGGAAPGGSLPASASASRIRGGGSGKDSGSETAAAGSEKPLLQQPLLPMPPPEWPGLPASALANDSLAGLLHGFDLSGLLRCVHVHKVWGDHPAGGGEGGGCTRCGVHMVYRLCKVRVLGLLPCC